MNITPLPRSRKHPIPHARAWLAMLDPCGSCLLQEKDGEWHAFRGRTLLASGPSMEAVILIVSRKR